MVYLLNHFAVKILNCVIIYKLQIYKYKYDSLKFSFISNLSWLQAHTSRKTNWQNALSQLAAGIGGFRGGTCAVAGDKIIGWNARPPWEYIKNVTSTLLTKHKYTTEEHLLNRITSFNWPLIELCAPLYFT